jgi:hypothetical protein
VMPDVLIILTLNVRLAIRTVAMWQCSWNSSVILFNY